MNGSLQVKNGYLYAVINYKDEAGKTKYKWVATGLKERGNRKAAKEILDKALIDFEEQQKAAAEKIERRSKPKEVDKLTVLNRRFRLRCTTIINITTLKFFGNTSTNANCV